MAPGNGHSHKPVRWINVLLDFTPLSSSSKITYLPHSASDLTLRPSSSSIVASGLTRSTALRRSSMSHSPTPGQRCPSTLLRLTLPISKMPGLMPGSRSTCMGPVARVGPVTLQGQEIYLRGGSQIHSSSGCSIWVGIYFINLA